MDCVGIESSQLMEQQEKRISEEGIDDSDAVDDLAVLHVFRE